MTGWSLLAALALSGDAAPPAPETRDDLRCFLALAYLADAGDDKDVKQAAMTGTLYFLGRLDGRASGLDLEAAATAELEAMTEADLQGLLPKCGKLIEERGNYLVEVGDKMDKRYEKAR